MTITVEAPATEIASHPRPSRSPKAWARAQLRPSWGLAAAALIAVIVAAPVIAVFAHVAAPTDGLWRHLVDTVLGTYLRTTLWLCLGVGLVTIIIGTGCAWLVTMHEFPGRRFFDWALVLPLAMPAYVLAYAYTDLLQFTGPVQGALRALTGWGWQDYWFPNIHSTGGAIFVLSAVLYPYVYVVTRAAFIEQSVCVLEVSRTLGCPPAAMFRRVALPLARPAIAAGATFALMETLADFGAVKYFEVQTFTTGIYRTWYAYGNPAAAAQLASALLLFVFAVLALERVSRGPGRYAHSSSRYRQIHRMRFVGLRAAAATAFCALPLLVGFLLPALALALMAIDSGEPLMLSRLAELARNTVLIGVLASLLAVGVALAAVYALKRDRRPASRGLIRVALLGYATPGVVIAVGILIAIGLFDHGVDTLSQRLFGVSTALVLGGSIIAVLYGCLVRFFAVAYSPLEAGLAKIRPSLEDAARTLGTAPAGVLLRLHLPLMRGSILSAGLLVFVDVMKELPATMILRPFNFDTLAIEAFQLATTERLDGAALPSLIIVAVGLVPVVILCRAIGRARPGQNA
jgi:iron(III) transport system permease protein